jgi:hypothetical protein
MDGDSEKVLPVRAGDWVESREFRPRIGRVRDCYWGTDNGLPVCYVDVVIYGYEGEKIGRLTPAEGGTARFEPALLYSDWFRIRKPAFPIELHWVVDEEGRKTAKYATKAVEMPDRTVPSKPRSARPAAPRTMPKTDYDPELEIRSRRLAAQSLRDIHRASPAPELLARAEQLEAEASRIAVERGLER